LCNEIKQNAKVNKQLHLENDFQFSFISLNLFQYINLELIMRGSPEKKIKEKKEKEINIRMIL